MKKCSYIFIFCMLLTTIVEFQIQFVINQDKSFQLSWCGIAVTKTDGSKLEPEQNANLLRCTNSLKRIYENSPDI
jgi:hypothetical protein